MYQFPFLNSYLVDRHIKVKKLLITWTDLALDSKLDPVSNDRLNFQKIEQTFFSACLMIWVMSIIRCINGLSFEWQS
jgi:hypothetical protein